MTETEFLSLADATLTQIEAAFERVADETDVDVDCTRSGNVLEIEFIDNGSKIIVNSQAPMQEMWVAAKAGGYHYRRENDAWRNTRDGSEMMAALSELASLQAGQSVVLK
jgi:CyaY protein